MTEAIVADTVRFRYRVECDAEVATEFDLDRWFTGRDASLEDRLALAGYVYGGNFDPRRSRVDPDRLVLVGHLDIPAPPWGATETRSQIAHGAVMRIVCWTLARLYRCRDFDDRSDPPGLVLTLRAERPRRRPARTDRAPRWSRHRGGHLSADGRLLLLHGSHIQASGHHAWMIHQVVEPAHAHADADSRLTDAETGRPLHVLAGDGHMDLATTGDLAAGRQLWLHLRSEPYLAQAKVVAASLGS